MTAIDRLIRITHLERAADRNAAAATAAIRAMATAVRDQGEGSEDAVSAEARADALFDEGEAIAAELLLLTTRGTRGASKAGVVVAA